MKSKGKLVLKGKDVKYVPQGIITAMTTPFDSEQEVDKSTLRHLIEWQIKAGIHGLMVTGGCGEFVNLSDDERKQALRVTLEAAAGRVPVIAGVLSSSTRHAVDLARHAESAGASAALVLTPYYINPSMDGVYRHFATIAEKSSIPIILYNNPGRTKIDMDAEILDRLAEIPTVVGIKECQRDIGLVSDRIHTVGDRIAVLAGDDDIFLPMYGLGSRGMIGVTALVKPEPMVEMWNALERGEWSRALEIHFNVVVPVIKAILMQNHPAPIKRLMALAGHPVGPARTPLAPPSTEIEARMAAVLRGLK
jgi:4-hydroxy-tetrahydrodipicolinate synthase